MNRAAQSSRAEARLNLAGAFELSIDSVSVAVPHGVQRVLAFLAIANRPVPRSRIAGQLWLDVPEMRALGNLRTALWRLRHIRRRIVRAIDERLSLDPGVLVDVHELSELSTELLDRPVDVTAGDLRALVAATDILPGWEDEWLVVERERFRELRLLALERACERLVADGDERGATRACLAAVEAEPFRESAQRLLMTVQLASGNRAAALRTYATYRQLLDEELGIEPSDLMQGLVASFESPRTSVTAEQVTRG